MRRLDGWVPVIVFASGDHAETNKRRVLRAGAIDYTYTWPALFERIEMVLADGRVSGRTTFHAYRRA